MSSDPEDPEPKAGPRTGRLGEDLHHVVRSASQERHASRRIEV